MFELLYNVRRCFLDTQELLDSLVSLTGMLNHRDCYCKLRQRPRETWPGQLEMNKTNGLSVINSYFTVRGLEVEARWVLLLLLKICSKDYCLCLEKEPGIKPAKLVH